MTATTVDIYHLELEGVIKRFGTTVAVNAIDLKVRQGTFVSLLGPSGCGKTTTLRLIAGLESPSDGEVRIGGQRVNDLPAYKRNVGLVFQNFALFPHMSVWENVAYGLKVRSRPKAEAERQVHAMLRLVDMAELAGRKPAELSGGQQQRVALARALVVEPALLLLDEPLGSLDAHLRIHMQSELKALQRRLEIPFVYVTHNQNEALAMSDQVVVMNRGQIEQIDPPGELFKRPKTRFVAEFVGKNNLLEAEVAAIDGARLSLHNDLGQFVANATDTDVRVGDRRAMVFRADAVRNVSAQSADTRDNKVTGTLAGIEAVGSIVTYVLELPDERQVRWERHGQGSQLEGLSPGDSVTLAWSANETILLR